MLKKRLIIGILMLILLISMTSAQLSIESATVKDLQTYKSKVTIPSYTADKLQCYLDYKVEKTNHCKLCYTIVENEKHCLYIPPDEKRSADELITAHIELIKSPKFNYTT